ncbi:MAG TPA: hypothetical protein VKO18_09105 [Terriglobia bacterium]|nr:hypothetical protein [Terriglobia bacterium]
MTLIHSDTSPEARDRTQEPGPFTRRDGVAVALLVASLVGMFWKVVFASAMFFYRDVYNYTFPSARLIHDLCRQGFLPYWNPYLNYGQAVLANPNLLFFYPFTLLIVLLPTDIAFTMHFLVHFALAGIGAYVLARSWGQTYLGAFFAAIVFMLSGPVLSLGNIYNLAACAAWIPWALWATDRALAKSRLRSWIVLLVIFSFQWLAGEPLTMLATFVLCFAYAFYRRGVGSRLWSKPNFRLLAIFFLVGAGIMLLCAAQLLPASSLLSQSRRGTQGLSFGETTTWSVNPFYLLEMMVPDFYGAGIAVPTGWVGLMSDPNLGPHYLSVFLGFVPLFCALAGWALGRDRRRNFVAGAAGAFLLLSFGHFTPVFALAYLLFPPLTMARYPVKLLMLVTFLVAILAGWGFDALRLPDSPWKTHGRRLLAPLKLVLGCILAILAVAWMLPALIVSPTRWVLSTLGETPFNLHQMPDFLVTMLRFQLPGLTGFCLGGIVLAYGLEQGKSWARPGLSAFALLAVGQLVMVNSGANPTVPKSFFTYRPPVLKEFKGPPGTYRVASFWPLVATPDTQNLQTYTNFDSIPEAADFGPMAQGALQARLQLATGSMLNQVEGNINLDLERSMPPYLYDVEIYQSREAAHPELVDCMLGRTNVKYILPPTRADSAATRLMGEVFNGSPAPSALYEDCCFVPRTYVAGNSLFSTNSTETLDHLAARDFDALNTVILAATFGSSPAVSGSAPAGQVEIVHRDPNSVTLRAELARPAYIVLLDRYDPNWQATLDGRPASVFRANQIFRAVYAGAGLHEIRFNYRQLGLRVGVVISLLTLTALVALYFRDP